MCRTFGKSFDYNSSLPMMFDCMVNCALQQFRRRAPSKAVISYFWEGSSINQNSSYYNVLHTIRNIITRLKTKSKSLNQSINPSVIKLTNKTTNQLIKHAINKSNQLILAEVNLFPTLLSVRAESNKRTKDKLTEFLPFWHRLKKKSISIYKSLSSANPGKLCHCPYSGSPSPMGRVWFD